MKDKRGRIYAAVAQRISYIDILSDTLTYPIIYQLIDTLT